MGSLFARPEEKKIRHLLKLKRKNTSSAESKYLKLPKIKQYENDIYDQKTHFKYTIMVKNYLI